MNEFKGEITAELVDVRFAFSGKVGSVSKRQGQRVKKGDAIAVLDRTFLKIDLEKELAAYEKTRAEFELFGIKQKANSDEDDIAKYLRVKQQADLDQAVKNTELAKFKMDESTMISPVAGTIVDMHGLVAGLYITPASGSVTIMNQESLACVVEVPQTEIFQFMDERQMRVYIEGLDEVVIGVQRLPTYGKKGEFSIPISLSYTPSLFPGMKAKATFKLD
jgi:multidrug resistance efflux pump